MVNNFHSSKTLTLFRFYSADFHLSFYYGKALRATFHNDKKFMR
jgi:hypothetical protein